MNKQNRVVLGVVSVLIWGLSATGLQAESNWKPFIGGELGIATFEINGPFVIDGEESQSDLSLGIGGGVEYMLNPKRSIVGGISKRWMSSKTETTAGFFTLSEFELKENTSFRLMLRQYSKNRLFGSLGWQFTTYSFNDGSGDATKSASGPVFELGLQGKSDFQYILSYQMVGTSLAKDNFGTEYKIGDTIALGMYKTF
ncbi:MAG: hypothetical protein O3A01_08555 [bacterium]|nr:hypothetical protein [bacterium]